MNFPTWIGRGKEKALAVETPLPSGTGNELEVRFASGEILEKISGESVRSLREEESKGSNSVFRDKEGRSSRSGAREGKGGRLLFAKE